MNRVSRNERLYLGILDGILVDINQNHSSNLTRKACGSEIDTGDISTKNEHPGQEE